MKRFMYIFYYLKHTDRKKLRNFIRYVRASENRSGFQLRMDMLYSVIRYKISFLDYFYFRFYSKRHAERDSYAGTGFMYEYQLIMNPKQSRALLEDKKAFLKAYAGFCRRAHLTLDDILKEGGKLHALMDNPADKIVIKNSRGQVGSEVEVLDCGSYTAEAVMDRMKNGKFDLAEEFVEQHPELMKLSPSGLNTVRIITQVTDNNKVVILGARLRISVNSHVDNLGAGNIAATVDVRTGLVDGPGVYSDITREDVDVHPVTGQVIRGFRVPYWEEVLETTRKAALVHPENRSIGWDVAVTGQGPELIEGNHNWCKLLWQLPAKKGMKSELEAYLD